jgi:hypothetical protein
MVLFVTCFGFFLLTKGFTSEVEMKNLLCLPTTVLGVCVVVSNCLKSYTNLCLQVQILVFLKQTITITLKNVMTRTFEFEVVSETAVSFCLSMQTIF